VVTTLAGSSDGFADGTGTTARFGYPYGVAVAPGGTVYVADVSNNRIRAINPTTSRVTTLAGSGTEGFADGTGTNAQFAYRQRGGGRPQRHHLRRRHRQPANPERSPEPTSRPSHVRCGHDDDGTGIATTRLELSRSTARRGRPG
jgi:hypothetical protein